MTVYYSILACLTSLGIIKSVSKYKMDRLIVGVSASILFFFAAMRSIDIGADTVQYCSHFLKIAATEWRNLGSYSNGYYGDIEFGYKIYNKILSVFGSRQTITIANSLLQIGLISVVIVRQSDNKWLSYFLYFTFCFYQTALNLTPSSFVSYFMFLSFPYIKDQKLLRFLIFVGIGMLFHTSAIFFIPLYFLNKIEITKKRVVLVSGGLGLIWMLFPIFIKNIIYIVPQKYIWYIDLSREHRGNTVELIVLLVQIIAIVFCIIQLEKHKRREIIEENRLISWMLLFEIILYVLSIKLSMFQRGAFLFSPYIIVVIPNIIDKIRSKNKKRITTACIVIYGLILYILRVQINNVGTTMPYQFFI